MGRRFPPDNPDDIQRDILERLEQLEREKILLCMALEKVTPRGTVCVVSWCENGQPPHMAIPRDCPRKPPSRSPGQTRM
jgi:hypothetical protein